MRWRSLLALTFLCFLTALRPASAAEARVLSVLLLERLHPQFGGLSGIELDADGTRAHLLSDKGWLFPAELHRKDGRLTGLALAAPIRLPGPDGRPLRARRTDSEGIARRRDGWTYVSFEGRRPRVLAYPPDFSTAYGLPPVSERLQVGPNSGPEALAADPAGLPFFLIETEQPPRAMQSVYALDAGRWARRGQVGRGRGFVPVGADVGPDGALYLLDRAFWGVGFQSRLRRIDAAGEAVLWESRVGAFGNLEGLAAWKDAAGRLRLTAVSDDNFMSFQRSELVDFVLAPR